MNVFLKTLQKNWRSAIWFSLISILFIWMYVALYPSLEAEIEAFQSVLDSYPQAILEAFAIREGNLFQNLEGTLAMYHYSIIFPLIFAAFAIGMASKLVTAEIENKTFANWHVLPLSNLQIIFEKYIAGFVITIFFMFLSTIFVIPFAELYNLEYSVESFLLVIVLTSFFGVAIYSLAFLIACAANARMQVWTYAGGLIVLMYGLELFASLNADVEWLKNFSLFTLYNYEEVLIDREMNFVYLGIYLLVSAICLIKGLWFFRRREVG